MPKKSPAAPKRRLTSNAELIRAQNPADARIKDALIEQLFKAPIPRDELQHNLFLFQDRRIISRLLFIHELYQHVLPVHGNILEFGVRYGANLALFTSFRGIYEPFNHNRKIVGFDTFSGFAGVNADKDAKEATSGSFSVTEQYEGFLQAMLALHESMAPVETIRKFELVKGDASKNIRPYLEAHPETVVALAYFDFESTTHQGMPLRHRAVPRQGRSHRLRRAERCAVARRDGRVPGGAGKLRRAPAPLDVSCQCRLPDLRMNRSTVSDCRIIELPKIADPRGNLTFIEGGAPRPVRRSAASTTSTTCPAAPRAAATRTETLAPADHRHVGQLRRRARRRHGNAERFHLNRSYYGLYICPMIWREIDNFSSGVGLHWCSPRSLTTRRTTTATTPSSSRPAKAATSMNVPFLDLGAAHRRAARAELDAASRRVMESGWYILGPEVEAFEPSSPPTAARATASAWATASTRSTLVPARARRRPGDEVIVPSNTYIATWLAVSRARRDAGPGRADAADLQHRSRRASKRPITPRTRAIIPVHLYGQPADMDAIMRGRRAPRAASSSRTPPRRTAPVNGRRARRARARRRRSASTRARTSARSATAARSPPTTRDWPTRVRAPAQLRLAREVRPRGARRTTAASTSCRRRSCGVKLRHLDEWNARRRRVADSYLRAARGVAGPRAAARCRMGRAGVAPVRRAHARQRDAPARASAGRGHRDARALPDAAAHAGGLRRARLRAGQPTRSQRRCSAESSQPADRASCERRRS